MNVGKLQYTVAYMYRFTKKKKNKYHHGNDVMLENYFVLTFSPQ